jgi:hypothetical protein
MTWQGRVGIGGDLLGAAYQYTHAMKSAAGVANLVAQPAFGGQDARRS